MDPWIGNLIGDVVIQGSTIVAICPDFAASADAIEIDVTDSIVMPGFVEFHSAHKRPHSVA